MKLLTYKQNGAEKIGVLSPGGEAIYPLSELGIDFSTMSRMIQERHRGTNVNTVGKYWKRL
jgi:hypothetical protein